MKHRNIKQTGFETAKRRIIVSAFVLITMILIPHRVPASQIDNLPVEQLPMMFMEAVDSNNYTNVASFLKENLNWLTRNP